MAIGRLRFGAPRERDTDHPYVHLEHRDVDLPDRQGPGDYRESNAPLHYIPTPY